IQYRAWFYKHFVPPALSQLRHAGTLQRIAVEGIRLPRRSIPRAILISDYLYRHDHAIGAELVGGGDAVVHKLAFDIDRKFERTDKVGLINDLDFVIARVFAEQIEAAEQSFVLVPCLIPRQHVEEGAFPTRPN